MSASVVIPTLNPGREIRDVLEALSRQEPSPPSEILVIDSGSTDGSIDGLREKRVRVIEIPKSSFNHGLTRAFGVHEARSKIVAFLTQDAVPADGAWLRSLVSCFDDPMVAGAYSRQIPRENAPPFARFRLEDYAATSRLRREQSMFVGEDFEALGPVERLGRIRFDNVSSAVRRDAALRIPFQKVPFGEDLDWGKRVLLAGYKIIYEPSSVVVHSHDRSLWYEFKRVYSDHRELRRLVGLAAYPTISGALWAAIRLLPRLIRYVAEDPRLDARDRLYWWGKAAPFAFSQILAQHWGLRSADPDGGGLLGRALSKAVGELP